MRPYQMEFEFYTRRRSRGFSEWGLPRGP